MADALPPFMPPGLPDIFGPSDDVDRIGLENANDRQQRTYSHANNKSRGGAHKRVSLGEEKESLECESAEQCKAVHYAIHLTVIGHDEKRRRFFTSKEATQSLNKRMLRKTRNRQGLSWSIMTHPDCKTDISTIVP